LIPAVVIALLAAACGDDSSSDAGGADGDTMQVVAAFYPLAEVVERVGGDRVDVENLTPAGAEPHDLELTPDDVDAIEDAGLVVVMGNGFQPAVEEASEARDGTTLSVLGELPIDAEGRVVADEHEEGEEGEEATEEGEEEHADEGDALDPHVWLDPVLMHDLVGVVTAALVEADPDGRAEYEANAEAYAAEVNALDEEFAAGLAACEQRLLVTSHDAFQYLADRYDLEVEGIAGLSPDAEPDPARLAELADLAVDEGVTTIFTETLVSPDIAETLAREAGGLQTAVLNPLEGLTEDEVDAGDDYLSVMRANLETLRQGLGCT
jgi:zinc transport system substrate-binding protein